MFTNAKIALAAALVLSTASAALADDAQRTREWVEFLAQIQNHAADGRTSFNNVTSPIHQADVSHRKRNDR